jgi:hypothetical protein
MLGLDMNRIILRRNLLNIISILIGIIGILLAVYFYSSGRRYRKIIFFEDPIKTEILNQERLTQAPIKVYRNNGDEIINDLISVRFYLWNAGTEAIHSNEVLRDIILSLDNNSSEIIDYRLLKISREVAEISLQRSHIDSLRSLMLSFSILEKNDGITGQIIYEGSIDSKLSIHGVIEGIDEFSPFYKIQLLRTLLDNVIGFIILLLIIVILGVVYYFYSKLMPKRIKSKLLYKVFDVVYGIIFSLFIILAIFFFVDQIVYTPLESIVKKDTIMNMEQTAPQNILPEQ